MRRAARERLVKKVKKGTMRVVDRGQNSVRAEVGSF
jgi:hypothetical protein